MNRLSVLLFQFGLLSVLMLPATSQDVPKDQAAADKAKAKAKIAAKAKAKAKTKDATNPRQFQRIVIELDANMNMMLERSEVPEPARKQFDELLEIMDKNGDKALDRDELRNAGQKVQKILSGNPSPDSAATAPPITPAKKAAAKKALAKKAAAAGLGDPAARIRQMDTNGDGTITRDEWVGQPQVFQRVDKNSDDKLDAGEQANAVELFKKFIEAAKKKMQDN
jgi:hypothetical protein